MTQNAHLDAIARDSIYALGCNGSMIRHSWSIARRHLPPGRLLEMGPAEGVMTTLIAAERDDLHLLEGSAVYCQSLRERFPQAKVHESMFEDFVPDAPFSAIVLGHVLEHVTDPVAVLKLVRGWMAPGARIFAAVPNARSLHRQAAVIMGLLAQEDAMSELDYRHGHQRVFNPESFRASFTQAGLDIEVFGGYWMKPVSNAQIDRDWTPAMLDAFMKLGERYPDTAAEIYVVASAG
ncbi:class I SAM-dependent methyltransferase [Roseateles sp. BYS78W]|uniref:Class I SAM-dependent methyltransferase n=1 Tax=Pelomonas candidula TaxID=3299025 RepID=A0ABW7HIF9_9BURK